MLHSKKEERKAGEGVGDQLESPIETHSIFVVFFFACVVVVFVRFGGEVGLTVNIVCFIE